MRKLLSWRPLASLAVMALLGLALAALFPAVVSAQSSTATEDDVRAAMVSHLPLFVTWPPDRMDAAHPQLRMCLLGADPIAPVLEAAFRNTSNLPIPVVFSHVSLTDRLGQCHMLYIGTGARGSMARLTQELTQAGVLTISERPIDSAAGQVIGLPLEDSHIRVEVNLGVAQNSRLIISSRLLRLASVVKRP